MTEKIKIEFVDKDYTIEIGTNTLITFGKILSELKFPTKIAIISNPTVSSLYGQIIAKSLISSGFVVSSFNLHDGEEYKNNNSLLSIYDFLMENDFDRGCGLIALGGGVVGDITGFAAATYLRGIPYVQIPTTILAQVDSSVGGKTAINLPQGKNLVGAFYQPSSVLIDTAVLDSLDSRDVSAGLAEVVKYGMIKDRSFFCWLEDNCSKVRALDKLALLYLIKVSCQIKADIVATDEREGSIRAILNYGHTFAHAIETLAGYGAWKHGEAVAAGMVIAAKVSLSRGLCSQQDVDRLIALLKKFDLPVDPPAFSLQCYVEAMSRDKKVKSGKLTMVLNRGIGEAILQPIDDIEDVFSKFL